ncbi:accessory gene regulator B family protein [Bacillus solimangrovi]|uniref:Accessory regulator AgrB n=1 Tax=Bacillus solimangrovi TaxID=1305675 RepID=A0A1E5LBA5_9BACI|nr:accessory gene regulator B family protein [Bacillus solimangrovi]OEH91374.1 hypothetical protein BFG57_05780 [Bacillus solimangrovi]
MITVISEKLANKLANATDYHEEEDYLRYSFEIIIGYVIKFAILFSLANLLNITLPIFALVVAFVSLRVITGGNHLSTFVSCMVFSILFIILTGLVFIYFSSLVAPSLFITNATIILSTFSCLLYAPIQNREREVNKNEVRKQTLVMLLFWYIILLLMVFFNVSEQIYFSIIAGVLLHLLSIIPLGTKGIIRLDHVLHKGVGK